MDFERCNIIRMESVGGVSSVPNLSIGDNCHIGEYTHITCRESIRIGNDVLTGRWCTITDNSHGYTDFESLHEVPLKRPLVFKGEVVIEDKVWLGDKVTILPGVTIGEGSVIGANSVVTKRIPPFSIVCGNPAKIIRQQIKI